MQFNQSDELSHSPPFQKVEGKVDREVEDEKKLKQGELIILKVGVG